MKSNGPDESLKKSQSPTHLTAEKLDSVDAWDEEELEEESFFTKSESTAFFGSMLVHMIVILSLALVPLVMPVDEEAVVIVSPAPIPEVEAVEMIENVAYSDLAQTEVGANSTAETEMAAASAEIFNDVAEIPNPVDLEPTELGKIMVNQMFSQAVAPLDLGKNQKGTVGQSAAGASGAVDRITFEILQSLEERPTLVVWLFDQSGSLHRQRQEIRDRFDRIYTELGIAKKSDAKGFRQNTNDIPLLTSIVGFGSTVTLFTEEPVEDLQEIQKIVKDIPVDTTGQERAFAAIKSSVEQFKTLRKSRGPNGPQRNVLFVVVTDERGDDSNMLEESISGCRKWGIPVYVIGVPAPFGREHTLVKYVDPDPKFDQTAQWAQVDQGPESLFLEQVQVGFTADFQQEPVIDSGFGPYALTRLCYETGGIYFTVHPNRNVSRKVNRSEIDAYASDMEYFFDPVAMDRYRPDYLAPQDYVTKVKASLLRQSLVETAQMRPATGLARPKTRFVRMSDAQLVGDLTEAQKDAAKLEPTLNMMATKLEPGMKVRDQEDSLRWKAGYDLAMGRVLAQKVRTEGYNLMLAKAKRGMSFTGEKNNTWLLEPANEITFGSKWEREAALAKELLEGVANDHKGTPWALLAKQELEVPFGWQWVEKFTDLSPPKPGGGGGNNNNNPAKDDQKRMLAKPPSRPIPKL